MVQVGVTEVAAAAQLATGVSVGGLIELLALAVGAGVGVCVGLRLAHRTRIARAAAATEETASAVGTAPTSPGLSNEASAPVWHPARPAISSTVLTLFATAVGFALIGFFCGSISGTVVLVALANARFLASGIIVTLANLVTGVVAGLVAGYLVEAFGRRWQMVDEGLSNARQRTVVIALAVGAVIGVLVGLLDEFGLGGTVLAVIGISAVSVATSLAVTAAQNAVQGKAYPEIPKQ